MVITAVEAIAKRRSRVRVYADGVAVAELPAALARSERLAPGRTIEQAEIDAIVAKEERRRAMAAAAAMLARRPHSERQVRQRLARRQTDAAVVDETVARLLDVRLLDDAEFARAWADGRDRSSPRGRRLVVQELRAAGVDGDVALAAASAIDDGDAAYRLAASRMRSFRELEYEAFRARLAGLLQRRGFGWDVVRDTVARCWREAHPGADDDPGDGAAIEA